MLRIKNYNIPKELEDYIIDTINESKDFTLLLNTDVYKNCTEDYLELFSEYPIYIEDLDITLSNIDKINIEDTNLEFYSNDVLICNISIKDKFYSITFDERNIDSRKYILTHSDRNVTDLYKEYPIINSSIEDGNGDTFVGKIYMKFSPLDFNVKNVVYEYIDKDYDMVSLKLLEQKKIIDNKIHVFSQLYPLTNNNIIICKYDNKSPIYIGKCIAKDSNKLILQNSINKEGNSPVFVIEYKDILDSSYFVVLQEYIQLVKIEKDKALLLSSNDEIIEKDINDHIELIKNFNAMKLKINRLYNELYFNNKDIVIDNVEECKKKLEEFESYIYDIQQLKIFDLDPSGFIVVDEEDNMYTITNIPHLIIKLNDIRSVLYEDK